MDAVDEVKSRLAIEDVIGEYVQLKRAGRNWKGLSPFSNEKTPSFVVSPEKQIWHDFSSGRGGSVFSFVMEMEGLDFKGALELLARKAGVDIKQYRSQGRRGGLDKERLYELLEATARFYQIQFRSNKTAVEYVSKKRKFTKETALEWRLGYAPNTGDALVKHLTGKGFTATEMKAAGVTSQRYRGVGDMFRARLMIPLADPQGRVIGFTARLLDDDPQAPKYINTPSTVLYDKSRHIYGLHLAKESIRKSQFVVMAEGNLDVIASHQAGVRQVVATAGTALTEYQLKALGRFTGDIRLSFDADKAGLNATERAIPIASRVKVSLSVITIPSGKDPDELIKQDPELWKEIIQKPQYALDWLMERYQKLLDITSAQGKRQYSDVLLPVVRALSDPVEQDHYLVAIAETIGVSVEALTKKLDQGKRDDVRPLKRAKTAPMPVNKAEVEYNKAQDYFLGLMLLQPQLRDSLAVITEAMFSKDDAKQLLKFLKAHPDFSGVIPALSMNSAQAPAGILGNQDQSATKIPASAGMTTTGSGELKELKPVAEYVKIIVLQYDELYRGLELTELQYEAARLQARLVEQYVKTKKQALAAQMHQADEATTTALLGEVRELDALLNQVKVR